MKLRRTTKHSIFWTTLYASEIRSRSEQSTPNEQTWRLLAEFVVVGWADGQHSVAKVEVKARLCSNLVDYLDAVSTITATRIILADAASQLWQLSIYSRPPGLYTFPVCPASAGGIIFKSWWTELLLASAKKIACIIADSAEQVLLNKRQIYGGASKVNWYPTY